MSLKCSPCFKFSLVCGMWCLSKAWLHNNGDEKADREDRANRNSEQNQIMSGSVFILYVISLSRVNKVGARTGSAGYTGELDWRTRSFLVRKGNKTKNGGSGVCMGILGSRIIRNYQLCSQTGIWYRHIGLI